MGRIRENSVFKVIFMIFIVVIIVFFAINCFSFFWNKFRIEQHEKIKTNVLTIQGKIKTIKGKSTVEKNEALLLGKKVSEIDNDKIKKKLKMLNIKEEDFGKYYLLNEEHFKEFNIDINEDEKYVVNYDNSEVIYIPGFSNNGKMVYKASDITQNDNNEKIIFELNK